MSQVQIILSEDVNGLGEAGDVVNVKPGYARNYLLPEGKASVATDGKVKELEHQKRVIEAKLAKELKDLHAVRKKIQGIKLEFSAQAGDEGKLFGSITTQQVAAALQDKGIEVDRRKIALSEPIKSVGEHAVTLRMRGDLTAEIRVVVAASE